MQSMQGGLPRLALAYYALMGLVLGGYAAVAPKHYFENFPLGQNWVAGDGPYNEHLMRDYGALNLALGAVALCALVMATRQLLIATAISQIVYAVPHVIYHLAHPSRLGDTTNQIGAIGGLIFNAVLGAVLLLWATQSSRRLAES